MNKEETLTALDLALDEFLLNDWHLLLHNISERSITHKIAEYLAPKFHDFKVDCEYNGDIDMPFPYRKQLFITEEEMIEIARQKIREDETYSVYPDIIVHSRGLNTNNHLIIEVKKENGNHRDKEFDILKLRRFTDQYSYRLGIYIELRTGPESIISNMRYFQNGIEKTRENLNDI
jgi:hypothetical protein